MSGKIMVVDDEVYVCRALRKSLEDMSFNVVEAYDGDEALAVYRHELSALHFPKGHISRGNCPSRP